MFLLLLQPHRTCPAIIPHITIQSLKNLRLTKYKVQPKFCSRDSVKKKRNLFCTVCSNHNSKSCFGGFMVKLEHKISGTWDSWKKRDYDHCLIMKKNNLSKNMEPIFTFRVKKQKKQLRIIRKVKSKAIGMIHTSVKRFSLYLNENT